MNRLNGPVKKLAVMKGPLAVGVFDDGTFLLAGPNDAPILLRLGGLMTPEQYPTKGDLVFTYFPELARKRPDDAEMTSDGWNPVETIPRDRKVLVKTVTGMERIAKVVHNAGVVRGRVHCWRRDKGKTGDLQAVAWKEINPGELK